jgi:hypothetical protein
MIDLELMNLKNASLLKSKELRRKIAKVKKKSWWRKRNIRRICSNYKHN